MRALHEKQQRILDYLLSRTEGATADEIAAYLGVTKTAAKEHLIKIESLGYLTYEDSKGSVGRPRRRYLLSSSGHEVFPRQYSWLSNLLLEHLAENMGAADVSRIMKALAKKVANSMAARFDNTSNSAELIAEIAAAMNELGYRTSLKQSDLRKGAILVATNCVYHSVAKQHPELCQFDVRFIESASKMAVELESCIARGDSVCRFCIRKK